MPRAKPREPGGLTFFIDECIKSSSIEETLRGLMTGRERIQVAKKGTLDEDWLRDAGFGKWVCFSRDRRMLSRPNELQAIVHYEVALFMIGEGTGAEHARLIADALPVVRRAALTLRRGFIARIEAKGELTLLLERGRWLPRARRMRPLKNERRYLST